ncbi:butyrophilin subfamily 3 member A2-like [Pagrus major]|uniref:butyrophilin subfamily 3 member A2-like n=1 Tax=Pagrus major TaxID=143350 RepID=UPI003CC8838F
MLLLKIRQLKSELTAFNFSVFYHTAVLLLLTRCCGGQFQVVGPLQPLIVTIGEDVILPCHLKPAGDAVGMTFEWARPDLNPRFVHVWHERQNLHVNQHLSYKGRTSVSTDKLKRGDISLKLSKVKLSDKGIYRCYFPDLDKDSIVQLVVATAASPAISLAGIDRTSGGVVLKCNSTGWYPEPEVFWLDAEGNLLSAGPTETVSGPDDLYTVSSRVTVEKRHGNSFTCRVQQNSTNQTRETLIHVPDDFFMVPSSSAACITISVVACFTCALAVVFAVWKLRRNKTETKMTSQEEQRLVAENDKKTAEIAEELQRKKEEHKDMADTLVKQKKALNKQRDELKDLRMKVEELVEDNESKLKSVEEAPDHHTTHKEIIYQNNWNLKDRLKELETMVLNTEKLLQMTEKVIVKTTEKKEAENQMNEK